MVKLLSEPSFLKVCAEPVAWLYRYWDLRRGDALAPRRRDIDPVDFKRLLPSILLVDVLEDPLDFRYRVVGTAEVARRRRDPTGKSVATHYYGPNREDALDCYRDVHATCRPHYDPRPYRTESGDYSREETLFLPLCEQGRRVSQILVLAWRPPEDP